MADPVALVSVVSSGAVALGGLLVTYRSGREQRKHESGLAYEARAWERKSEALFGVIAAGRLLIDSIQSNDPALARVVHRVVLELEDVGPVVEAYASGECRTAFVELQHLLNGSYELAMVERALYHHNVVLEVRVADDYNSAADVFHEDQEQRLLRDAKASLTFDLQTAQAWAEKLIDAARKSVRGEA
jgi:hypothetical protein